MDKQQGIDVYNAKSEILDYLKQNKNENDSEIIYEN